MYAEEHFTELERTREGCIEQLINGIQLTLNYKQLILRVNAHADTVHVEMVMQGIKTRMVGNPTIITGHPLCSIQEKVSEINSNILKRLALNHKIHNRSAHVFSSQTTDNYEILTAPVYAKEDIVKKLDNQRLICVGYAFGLRQRSVEDVYGLHEETTKDKVLVHDRAVMENGARTLVGRLNKLFLGVAEGRV